MKLPTHLLISELEVAPGAEWTDSSPGWKIILIGKGILYWMSRAEVQELSPGQVLVIGPSADGVLRGSQISASSIHFFYFRPENLLELLSLSERLSLGACVQASQKRIIPASDPVAHKYAEVVRALPRRQSFFYRSQLLQLAAMVFRDTFPGGALSGNQVATTQIRFEEIISRIPEVDLINHSSSKIAEMCGCSLRHFRRMFRAQFKTSIRAKQTELRLEKARQLLAVTDDKILAIAANSGYRHTGFFNAMFKKRFGMTPTEWRKFHRPQSGEKRIDAVLR